MRRTAIVSLAFVLIMSFVYSTAEAADFFVEKVQVIDGAYQDDVFGGSGQPTLIISFTPGDGLVADGDYAVIVDVDGDGNFNDEPGSSYVDTGTAVPDSAKSVTWNINTKLSSLADGDYEIAVVIDDNKNGSINWSGNIDEDTEDFTLDRTLEITEATAVPEIFSPNGDGVKDTVIIYYTLSETLFGANEGVDITIGEGQLAVPAKPVPGVSAGRNAVMWDGKDGLGSFVADGQYNIKIEAYDAGGNEASETIQVKVSTKLPGVVSTTPEMDSAVRSLVEVAAKLQDNSGEGIDLANSKIWLENPNGAKIAGVQRDNGQDTIRWRLASQLPGDGSADGLYSIVVIAVDKIGNTRTARYTFFYDTIFPQVTSVTPPDMAVMLAPPSAIVVVMNDGSGSGVDLAATADTMVVQGSVIAGSVVHNGVDTVTFTPFETLGVGLYTIEIEPTDLAGNKPSLPMQFQFNVVESLEDILPEVKATAPKDRAIENVLLRVGAALKDNRGKGIDFDASTIRLVNPQGAEVPGRQTKWEFAIDCWGDLVYVCDPDCKLADAEETIVWELNAPLPIDGSADGVYTIRVRAVDKTGGAANYTSTFRYDTQAPTIVSTSPVDGAILTGLSQIVIRASDGTGSGINFAATMATMTLSGVPGDDITREHNSSDTMTFTFPALEAPGTYSIQITIWDNAGRDDANTTEEANGFPYKMTFNLVEDMTDLLPKVSSVEPRDRSLVNMLAQVSATLTDRSGKGIDLDLSTIRLTGPGGKGVAGIQTDNDIDTIAWELASPLPTNGTADGTYTISVNAIDKAGGTTAYSSTFVYDTQVPTIVSITPADGSVLTKAPDQVVMVVSDGAGSGVDFAASRSSMSLSGVANIIREDNGVDAMTFSFAALKNTGEYTITITLSDRAGNQHTYQSEFEYVEEVANVLPEVGAVVPAKRSFVNFLTQVSADLIDNSGKGINLNLSTIRLVSPGGVEAAGVQTDNKANTIVWQLTSPLPTDGSADGTYTINVNAVDKTGGKTAYSSTFVYDTQVPAIVSITPADGSVLTEAPDQVVIVVSDGRGSGIDFAASRSSMSLSGVPDIIRVDNGVGIMTFSFAALKNTGEYTITITLSDRAGNQHTYQSEFEYVEEVANVLPEVEAVTPPARAFVNMLTQASADLIDNSGKGINLNLSTIRLVSPGGVEVAGIQTDNKANTIVWQLASPLPTNGTADGTYTINVNAVDKAGGTTAYSSTFVYDTQVPTIVSITPADGSVLTEAPNKVVIVVSDGAGSGVDFAASRGSMSLSGVANIVRQDNGVDTMTFSFAAIKDTATYTVTITLSDKAGNQQTYQSEFDFVEKPEDLLPEVSSVNPADRSLAKSVSQVSADLIDNSGKGINLNLSTIRLVSPGGVEVAGVQTDNKANIIVWQLTSPLPTDGSADGTYTINVNAVDKAGGTTSYSSTFVYDTQVPTIVSITPADGSVLTEAPDQVVIVVSDGVGSGVDFAASRSSMSLSNEPDIIRVDNGVDAMTFSFAALKNTGEYIIAITLSDRAGNQQTYQSRFEFVEETTDVLPEVSSVVPGERASVNTLLQVTAVLTDKSGKGISLTRSAIRLMDPRGVEVSGIQTDNKADTIVWQLTSPLPTNGTADGTYTISVSAEDKAGGKTAYGSTFVYDSLSPSVVATSPAANEAFYEGISQATVKLNDSSGSGVDLENTEVNLRGPGGLIQTDRSNNGRDTIVLTFSKLTDSGNYTIEISPRDRAGNTGYPVNVKFSYVLKAPAVKSVSLTNRAYVSSLESIEAVLEDRSGIGLDLSETGSSIVVTGPEGELQADQTDNGVDTIIWRPVHLLATDGTDDGEYTVTVTPMDVTGGSGQQRRYTVIYDTQPPEVVSASPVDINADITHVSQQLIAMQAQIRDEGPAGIEIADQTIYLEAADGTQVPGVQTNDSVDKVTWNLTNPLPKDGSADGIYTVVVIAVDQAGAEKEFRYPLAYDTIRPQVTQFVPVNNSMLSGNITEVIASLSDAGGEIDFQRSGIELQTPSGGSVSGTVENNGVDTMTLRFTRLEENGTYTIVVTAVDKAGNGADAPWICKFVFETGLPVVVNTVPVTDSIKEAYVHNRITLVQAMLQQTDGGGIDLSPTGSRIRLRGPDGSLIVGTQSNNRTDTLVFTLGRPRTTDGTEDGAYTILVTAVNEAGRRDEERGFSFVYDTQAPVIASISHLSVKASLSYVNQQITEMEVRLEDKGPSGIDIDRSAMKLIDPNGNIVEATYSGDDVNTMKAEFPAGLPREGRYSLEIIALDKAGNVDQQTANFIYAVSVPEVVATIPVDEAYINAKLIDVRAELRETGSGGIDFSPTGSSISLRSAKGYVNGKLSNDGNILIFTLTDALAVDGRDDGEYTISVTPANSAKLKGPTAEAAFIYDTVAPEVEKDGIALWTAGEAGSSLTEISAVVKDKEPGSGVDWENFDNSWMILQDASGGEITGEVSVNSGESQVILLLDVPLASNGSQDGYYTVTVAPVDKAGNAPVPGVQYEFLYDTRPPTVKKAEITINEKILILDSSLDEYPTAVNTKNGVTITAIMEDDGIGVDLTKSSIKVSGPGGDITGSLKQDGVSTIWLTTGILNDEGLYTVEINPVDLHDNGTGKSSETVFTKFLFEETAPAADLTEPATNKESKDVPITLKGTAVDNPSSQGVPVSGVAKVEIGGTGPGGKRLDWIQAEDDSDADEDPWKEWSLDFLPDASGTYKIEMQVWDEAGNSKIYATNIELEFTVSLSFQGDAYCWPNPVTNGVAHISFEINTPGSHDVTVTLYVYDVSGDLVYMESKEGVAVGTRDFLEWDCTNAAGEKVVTGIYLFRLEAELDNQVANKVGKPMIIKN